MTDTYGGRVGVAIVLAVLLHAGAAAAIAVFGFQAEPYPESASVTVTLPEYEEPEPEPETEEPEAEEPPVRAAQPERTQSDSAQRGPPAEERPQTDRTESAQPAPPQSPAEETPSPSRRGESDNGTSSAEPSPDDDALSAEERAAAREEQRTDFAELSRIDEDESVSDLPGWAAAGEILERPATESPASQAEQAELARQLSSQSQEFANTLRELQRALDQDPSAAVPRPSAPGDESSDDPTPTGEASGSEFIQWFGGERAALSAEPPDLTAADFGGQVPAVVNYVVVFEVDASGRVVPGSLILTRSSGYTAADQKVRRAVQGWRFQSATGSPNVTAIATLQILRGEIQ